MTYYVYKIGWLAIWARNCLLAFKEGATYDFRDDHGDSGVVVHVGHFAGQSRDASTASNAGDDQARASFIMATQASDAEGDDGRETDTLEEQDQEHHRQPGVFSRPGRGAEEDDHARQVREKDPSRLCVFHKQRAGEAADGERTLGAGQELGGQRAVRTTPRLDGVVDEVAGDGDLGAHVRELCERGVEETVLFAEGLVGPFDVRLLDLELHVGVGHFGDVRGEEDKGQDEDENGNAEIDPLHVLQGLDAVLGVDEEDVGSQDWSDHGSDLEMLIRSDHNNLMSTRKREQLTALNA